MTPYKHQESISNKALDILRKNLIVYLAMEERTGKTLTSILTYEKSKCKNILVVTKKKAIAGWEDTFKAYGFVYNKVLKCWESKTGKKYLVINYESLHLVKFDNDACIIDEAHSNLGAYPKIGKIWKLTYNFTRGRPIIFMSATPSAQTYSQLYHQLKLSSWTPWIKYPTFYSWHKVYGIEKIIFLAGRQLKQYNEVKNDLVLEDVKHLFISYKRQELGFEHEPKDILHYIELSAKTKSYYNELLKHNVLEINGEFIVADTPMSLRTKLHQLEGATIKYKVDDIDKNIIFDTNEKIEYIKNKWGDSKDLVIFYQYIAEKKLLEAKFKNSIILQGTSFAEGVDLSMYKTCVVYSMDFSTAKYTQRRARQCNMKREEPIDFHFLLCKDAISEQVYNTVAVNKSNFVDTYFNKKEL